MTLTRSVDALFDPTAEDYSRIAHSGTNAILLSLALASWVLGEAVMAPVLQPFAFGLWIMDLGCFFIFAAWYFRVSRLFDSPWTSYGGALPHLIWTLAPLYLVLPAGLLLTHLSWVGLLVYEITKAGVILAVLSRMMRVFQDLNRWPRWAALGLVLSPLAMAFIGTFFILGVGGVSCVALALNVLQH